MCAEWNTWVGGSCQSTCGSGLKVHTRTCQDVQNNVLTDNSNCELLSPEDSSETRECEEVLPPCPVWTDWKYGPCTSSSGVGNRIRTRDCVENGTETETSGCPGDSCESVPCSGSKSCEAYDQRKIDTKDYGGYWGNHPTSFSVNAATAREDCLNSCIQESQCNYALVDLTENLCWNIENPLGYRSNETGYVSYQCGFGLPSCPDPTAPKTCDEHTGMRAFAEGDGWGYDQHDVTDKAVCETGCLDDDKCVASVFSDYFSMCWFLYVHPSKVYNGYDDWFTYLCTPETKIAVIPDQ